MSYGYHYGGSTTPVGTPGGTPAGTPSRSHHGVFQQRGHQLGRQLAFPVQDVTLHSGPYDNFQGHPMDRPNTSHAMNHSMGADDETVVLLEGPPPLDFSHVGGIVDNPKDLLSSCEVLHGLANDTNKQQEFLDLGT